ncbi:MAG TPA: TIGR03668 family PPOX class F420-dependent oxidoreductase [Streptosporangiaceae bacterium]|nr:TIGR03668 family PPOX class F420-dependent oxidoreductase [Streptosporangiaceae bacterium]
MPRLAAGQARRLLAAARVARLATASPDGIPHLVPVTFALDGDTVYTAVDGKPKTTARLRRLDNIRRNPAVALLADYYAEDWAALWWARADGTASVIEDPALMAGPARLLAGRYPQYATVGLPGPVIAIRVTHWSGWAAAPGSPGAG